MSSPTQSPSSRSRSRQNMFLVRLKRFDPVLDATSRLAQISKEADIIFTALAFRMIATNHFPHFVVSLQMSKKCFPVYSINSIHRSRVSLEPFHDAMLDSGTSPTMTMHLFQSINKFVLRFETPSHEPQLHHDLVLLPPKEKDIENINLGKFFSVQARDLRRVIKELPIFLDDSVCITVTDTLVKFSVASHEIKFTRKRCEIVGLDGEETQFRINLYPMLFFLDLTYDVLRIYFYRTTSNTHSVMLFPTFDLFAQYLFYFPDQ